MFLFSIGQAAVILFALTQSLTLASLDLKNSKTKALAKRIVRYEQGPWIDEIASVIRPFESSCMDDIAAVIKAIRSGQIWALQMFDASSKLQSGILQGNIRDLGMYDQCIEVNGRYNDTTVRGRYCTVSFDAFLSSVCVPSSCDETQIIGIVNAIMQNVTSISELELGIIDVSCVKVGSENFTAGEIATIIFFATIIVFIVFCTICEFVKKYRPDRQSSVITELAKFSLYTNVINILSTTVSPQMMPAIQGMRFLSMCWVVLGHRYVVTPIRPMINSFDILKWYASWPAVHIQAAPFAVDTFFVISGFLMSYLYLKSKKSGKKSNFPMMYLHRYLRLTPCLAVLVLFVAVLLHRVSNGPVWKEMHDNLIVQCQRNWWVNLLYIQNFLRAEDICLPHSWYLAVDMQLFWISPIILYPLHRWPKHGLRILCLLLFASVVTPTVVLAINSYSNAVNRLELAVEDSEVDFVKFYIPTYNRACAYFVGILLGYDVANTKRSLSQTNVVINWVLACFLMLACAPATHFSYSSNFEYNRVVETAFAAVLRPIWSIAIAWIVYACTQGYGGPVTSFLSMPIFMPLSRLSYCIYLVHFVIQATKIATSQTPGRFSDMSNTNLFFADLFASIAIGFIFSLFFESPVVVLEKMLTSCGRKRRPSTSVQWLEKNVERGIDNKGMTGI